MKNMSITVSIKVRKELVRLAEKMIKYGMASNRSQAFNLMIAQGLPLILKKVRFWDEVYSKAEELEKTNYGIRHGGLTKLLEEDRSS